MFSKILHQIQKNLFFFITAFLSLITAITGFTCLKLISVKGDINSILILFSIGYISDTLDGKIARAKNCSTTFGKELDSLCDVILFGSVPTLYIVSLSQTNVILYLSGVILLISILIRLALFSSKTQTSGYFYGLPSSVGAILVIASIYHGIENLSFFAFEIVLISILLNTNVKFYNFKSREHPVRSTLLLFIIIIIIGFFPAFSLAVIILYSIAFYLNKINWKSVF